MRTKLAWLLFPCMLLGVLILKPTVERRLPLPLDIVTGVYYPWLNYRYQGLTTSTPVKNPLLSDPVSLAYPWRNHLSQSFRAGISPLWNKNSLSGLPFLGSFFAVGPYNPATWISSLLPSPVGISLFLYGQLILVALAGYLLLRTHYVSFGLSLVGGLALSMGGLATTWFEYGSGNYSLAAILFLLATLEQTLRLPHPAFWPLPLALLFLVMTGNPQLILYGWLLAAAYILARPPQLPHTPRLSARIISQFLLAGVISLVLLLPVYRVYQDSIRPGDRYIEEYAQGTLPFKHLFTLISPDYFGHPATYNYHGAYNYLELAGYGGLLTVSLFLLSHFVRPFDFPRRFYLTLTWLALILSTTNPLTSWLYGTGLPIISTSAASRLLYLFDLGFIISACLTLNQIIHRSRWLFFAGLIGLALALLSLTAQTRAVLPTVAVGLALFVVAAAGTRFRRLPVVWLFSLILLLDLGRYFLKFNPYTSIDLLYPVTPEISFLQTHLTADGPARFQVYGSAMMPPNFNEVYELESASGYHSAYPRLYGEFVGIINDGAPTPNPGRYIEIKNPGSPLFDFLNIRYVLLNTDSCTATRIERIEVCAVMQDSKFVPVYRTKNLAIYENSHATPRFQLISNYQVTSSAEVARGLADPDFIPSALVYLESTPSFPPQANPAGAYHLLAYTDSRIKLGVELSAPALLVVSNTYDPGWSARVGSVHIPVLRANYAFQAYPLSAGNYEVELVYSLRP